MSNESPNEPVDDSADSVRDPAEAPRQSLSSEASPSPADETAADTRHRTGRLVGGAWKKMF